MIRRISGNLYCVGGVYFRVHLNSDGSIHQINYRRQVNYRGPGESEELNISGSAEYLNALLLGVDRLRSPLAYQIGTYLRSISRQEPRLRERVREELQLPENWDRWAWSDFIRNYGGCYVAATINERLLVGRVGAARTVDGVPTVELISQGDVYLAPLSDVKLRPDTFGLINSGQSAFDVAYLPSRQWRRGIRSSNCQVRDIMRNTNVSLEPVVPKLYNPEYLSLAQAAERVYNGAAAAAISNQIGLVASPESVEYLIVKNRLRAIGLFKDGTIFIPPINQEYIQMLSEHGTVEVRE